MAKLKTEIVTETIERLIDGATHELITAELVEAHGITPERALSYLTRGHELIARAFDANDYAKIKAYAFAGDAFRQKLYRERIADLLAEQKKLPDCAELELETRIRLGLAMDRAIQAYASLSLRGRRDLPVAFAPKDVLQDQSEPDTDDIDEAIKGAL